MIPCIVAPKPTSMVGARGKKSFLICDFLEGWSYIWMPFRVSWQPTTCFSSFPSPISCLWEAIKSATNYFIDEISFSSSILHHALEGDRLVELFRILRLLQMNSCIFMEGSTLKGVADKYSPSSLCKKKNEIIADFDTPRNLLAVCNRKKRDFPPFLRSKKVQGLSLLQCCRCSMYMQC